MKKGWYKSTRSQSGGDCVEVNYDEEDIQVRDSKNPHGPMLRFTRSEWDAFVGGVKDGEFDL